jgi:hypothetical protein
MSTAITTINLDSFRVSRVSKSGKESYRGLIGVMSSGNTAERKLVVSKMIETMWVNGTFKPIVAEVRRVFNAKQYESGAGFCGLDFMAPRKDSMLAYITGIVRSFDDKDPKGEKGIYVAALANVLKVESDKGAFVGPRQLVSQ